MGVWSSAYSSSLLQKATPNTRPLLCLEKQTPHSVALAAPFKKERAALAPATSAREEARRLQGGQVAGAQRPTL